MLLKECSRKTVLQPLLGTASDNTMWAGKETEVEKPRILRPLVTNQALHVLAREAEH